jgi:predicted Zn-dependent protease
VNSIAPNHIPAITRLAQIYRASNEPRELVNLADRILAGDPENAGARILKAEGLIGLGRPSEARNLLSTPVTEPSLRTDAALLLARALVAEGQVVRGEQELRKLYVPGRLDLRPLNALSDLLLARRAVLKGPDQLAMGAQIVDLWSKELARFPDSRPVRRAFAIAGQYEKAISLIADSAADDLEAQTLRAASLFALGRRDEAVQILDRVSKIPNANSNLLDGLVAYIYTKQGDAAAAERYYNQILARDPKSAFAMNNLAYILAERKDRLPHAHKLASEAVALEPDNPDFQDTLGLVLLQSAKNKEAASLFSSLSLKHPRNPGIRYHYALALLATGQRTRAGTELTAALSHSPDQSLTSQIRAAQELVR